MNARNNQKEVKNSDFEQNDEFNDYEYLLSKLKEIKDTITLLESKFLLR